MFRPVRASFLSSHGAVAQPYVILFATQGKDGKPTAIPDDLVAEVKAINERNRNLERIRADIYMLRHFVTPFFYDGWMGASYRLAQDGRRRCRNWRWS